MTLGILLVAALLAAKSEQQSQVAGQTSTLYVYVIGELAPDPIKDARIQLYDLNGKLIRNVEAASASDPRPGRSPKGTVILREIPFGVYDLKIRAPELNPTTRRLTIDQNEHWLVVALGLIRSERWPGLLKVTIKTSPGSLENPMWARLVGVYSQTVVDARVREDGQADFVVSPSTYILLILRGNTVCVTRQIEVPWSLKNEPLMIDLPEVCQQR